MKNLLLILALATVFAFTANAQSKDCCSKEKVETSKVEKCDKEKVSMKSGGDKVETSNTTKSTEDKLTVQKDVVTKTQLDKKEKCDDNSACCDGKKEKKLEKETQKN